MYVDIFNTERKYNIIYADPAWEYRQTGSKTSCRGMAKQHYNTMATADICGLPVKKIKTDNALCFMWATFPNIGEALKVMESWGFEYKTAAFTWIKTNKKNDTLFWGMGAYTRANAEVCLLGISKETKAKSQVINHGIHSVIMEKIQEHSRKPEEARKRIEALLGDVPRIELFARTQSPGWDYWGNETDKF